MDIKNKYIETINADLLYKEGIHIENCIIKKVLLTGCSFVEQVTFKGCIIDEINCFGTWFGKGLHLSGCIFNKSVSFEASGHNEGDSKLIIENSLFRCFVDFFDAHFEGPFIFKNNILMSGSNLLENSNPVTSAQFVVEPVIEDIIGVLNSTQ